MRKIKFLNYIGCFLIVFFIQGAAAQTTQEDGNAYYVGTWKYQNGNHIFRLIIWEDPEINTYDNRYYLNGHYEMSELNGNTETLVYTSNPANVPATQKLHCAFSGILDNNVFSGLFSEIHTGGSGLKGNFAITLQPLCMGCSAKINWSVTKLQGGVAHFPGQTIGTDFVVPNNITLTKQ